MRVSLFLLLFSVAFFINVPAAAATAIKASTAVAATSAIKAPATAASAIKPSAAAATAIKPSAAAASAINPSVAAAMPASDSTGTPLPLFRGRVAPIYTLRFNGTPYWDNGGFRKGKVFFNGRLYSDILLNIDCQCQGLVVRNGASETMPSRELVAWFTRDDKMYVNLEYYGLTGLGEGFFEQYSGSDGSRWYHQVRKEYNSSVDNKNGKDGIGYDDPAYSTKCLSYFGISDKWYTWSKKKSAWVRSSERKARKAKVKADQRPPEDNRAYDAPRQVWKSSPLQQGNQAQPQSPQNQQAQAQSPQYQPNQQAQAQSPQYQPNQQTQPQSPQNQQAQAQSPQYQPNQQTQPQSPQYQPNQQTQPQFPQYQPNHQTQPQPRKASAFIQSLPASYFDSGESENLKRVRENLRQNAIIAQSRNKTYVIGTPAETTQASTTPAESPQQNTQASTTPAESPQQNTQASTTPAETTPAKAPHATTAPRATINGTVRDIATGEPLQGALVSNESGNIFVYTDKDGHYGIDLPTGEQKICARVYGKEDMSVHIILHSDGILDIMMQDQIKELQSAYVSAQTRQEHRRTAMGMEKITAGVINKIPSAFGTGDVMKAILTIPGVKSAGEAGGGLNVRGGSTDQNLILLCGGTIFNPSHMFGVMSSFNPDIIESAELYKSSIPARFGGRISSVLDVNVKEGGRERIHGSLGIGILTSSAEIDGPLGKSGRTTFVVSGRTTYSDWMLKAMPKNSGYAGGTAGFYDINASITHRFDDNNKLRLFGYYSRDRFSFSSDTTFRYNNLNVSLLYSHKGPGGRSMTLSAGYDEYGNTLEDGVKNSRTDSYTLRTGIRQGYARLSFLHPLAGGHNLSYGADATLYILSPGSIAPSGDRSNVTARTLPSETGIEPALYVSDDWKIGSGPFSLEYGARLSSFLSAGKFYAGPEARVGAKYTPTPNFSLKAGFNNLNQYIHLICNTAGISPMDFWRLSSERIRPQKGWQAAGGAYWSVAGGKVDLSMETYFKQMYNYLDYKSGAQLQMNSNLPDDLVSTHARAYGVELMAKKSVGKLTGWLAYTFSRTLLQEDPGRGAAAINAGAWYPAAHDKPHEVALVCNYAFTHRYSISMNLDYATGRPVTVPVAQYYYNGALRLAYSERNAHRIPDYFRLDLALNIEPGHYLKAFTHASATIGCYNVTGRKNAYSVYYTTNSGTHLQGYMVSVFATPIPYITINLKF